MHWVGLSALPFVFAGFILFYKFPSLQKKKSKSPFIPEISIIVPARNEEKNLPVLLASLKNQTLLPREIIVVDDSSTDKTAQRAEEHGAQTVASGELPEGWLGKPWSCYQGAIRAGGDLFVFLDADTFLEPDALEKIICNFWKKPGAMSIFPFHRIKKAYEVFSAFLNLMQLAGMHKITLKKDQKPVGMFGPCLVISRKDYFKIEGHKSVRGEVLEHYVMATALKERGVPVRLFRGKGSVNVRMYPEGWKSLIMGWSKSFARGADLTPPLNMAISVLWISGLIVSSILFIYSLFSGNVIDLFFGTAIYLLCLLQVIILFRRVGNFPLWAAVLYPLNLLFFLSIFIYSSFCSSKTGGADWKGRKIN